jgi:hypothetical protein
LNLPLTLKEFGVEEAEFEKHLDQMAAGAVKNLVHHRIQEKYL